MHRQIASCEQASADAASMYVKCLQDSSWQLEVENHTSPPPPLPPPFPGGPPPGRGFCADAPFAGVAVTGA